MLHLKDFMSPHRLRDIRVWGIAFLAASLLTIGVAVWLGYHSPDSHTLLSQTTFTGYPAPR